MAQGADHLEFLVPTLPSSCRMLQIRMLSSEEICVPVEEIHDVRALNRHLHQLRGFPLGSRQRFLLHGERLEDAFKLDSPMDLDVVLLQFVEVPQEQVHDLVQAANDGSMAKVESSLQLPQDPDLSLDDGCTALIAASGAGRVEVSLPLQAGATDGSTAQR